MTAEEHPADAPQGLDAAALKQTFSGLFEQAKGLQARYAPEIAERARTLDLKRLTDELRGG